MKILSYRLVLSCSFSYPTENIFFRFIFHLFCLFSVLVFIWNLFYYRLPFLCTKQSQVGREKGRKGTEGSCGHFFKPEGCGGLLEAAILLHEFTFDSERLDSKYIYQQLPMNFHFKNHLFVCFLFCLGRAENLLSGMIYYYFSWFNVKTTICFRLALRCWDLLFETVLRV